MTLYITSDVHLGSRHCRVEQFERFLGRLPPEAVLVLNGDTMDHVRRPLPFRHRAALARLLEESRRRRVVWVGGNHDEAYRPPGSEAAEFVPAFSIPGRLHVVHGFYLYRRLPGYAPFILLVKGFHRLRILLGAEPVHVAEYVKQWEALYNVLRRHARESAVRYAKGAGVGTVVCGHVHCPEDTMADGIRYVNTGSWTEDPPWCFRVEEDAAMLCRVTPEGELEATSGGL